MAKIENKEIIEAIKEKTILELNELVDMVKEEFGVDPSAAMVAAAPVQGGAAADAEPSTVNVTLKDAGTNKLAVIKLIKEITGLGLGESKALADNGGVVKEKVSADEAKEMKAKFEEAGATVELN